MRLVSQDQRDPAAAVRLLRRLANGVRVHQLEVRGSD
jgi:hypothetical protein